MTAAFVPVEIEADVARQISRSNIERALENARAAALRLVEEQR
jgi:hypothetical protein